MAGWIKVHREMLAWEWYQDANTMRVFLHLLLTANYEDKKYKGVLIKRGQCMISVKKLSEDLRQTVRQTRTALDHLKSTGEVTIESTNKFSLITITNYEKFQGVEQIDKAVDNFRNDKQNDMQSDKQTANKQPKSDKQTTNLHYLRNKESILSKKLINTRARAREGPVDKTNNDDDLFASASKKWEERDE